MIIIIIIITIYYNYNIGLTIIYIKMITLYKASMCETEQHFVSYKVSQEKHRNWWRQSHVWMYFLKIKKLEINKINYFVWTWQTKHFSCQVSLALEFCFSFLQASGSVCALQPWWNSCATHGNQTASTHVCCWDTQQGRGFVVCICCKHALLLLQLAHTSQIRSLYSLTSAICMDNTVGTWQSHNCNTAAVIMIYQLHHCTSPPTKFIYNFKIHIYK